MSNTALLINFNTISINVKDISKNNLNNFILINGNTQLIPKNMNDSNNNGIFSLNRNIDIKEKCKIIHNNGEIEVSYNTFFDTEEFHNTYYTNENLGCVYNYKYTMFSLWAPTAKYVNLVLYKSGEFYNEEPIEVFKMDEGNNGVWRIKIEGNLSGYFYNYKVTVYGEENEVVDPYAHGVSVNGLRGAIIDFETINKKIPMKKLKRIPFEESIIYELSVRDMTMDPNSKVKKRGKFLGLIEEGSKNGISTGFNSVKELGVSHLQFMPIFDFSYKSTEEKFPYKYNWGYDPQNFNVPEGSYSLKPEDPRERIYELKKLINHIHSNEMYVNMDVVYNHVYEVENSNFEKIFPGYYFRKYDDGTFSNGTGVGNDIASERSMVRKYILDSIMFWVEEYKIDGFRMDLMGILDIDTINIIRKKLDEIDENIMLYGEGWNLNTTLPENKRAIIKNSSMIRGVGHFNDVFRDTLRGSNFNSEDNGYISFKENMENSIKYIVTGSCLSDFGYPIFNEPTESINYICAHDDNTLYDKLRLSTKEHDIEVYKDMVKLGASILLTSQGIPFIHSGMEFLRTKNLVQNSYNYSDLTNRIDWLRKNDFLDVYNYFKTIIKIRKKYDVFKFKSKEELRENIEFIEYGKNIVSFLLGKKIFVIYNSNRDGKTIQLPEGTWIKILDKHSVNIENEKLKSNEVNIYGISVTIFKIHSN